MLRYGGLDKNFRFLVLEVGKQVERAHRLLGNPDQALMHQIRNRDDYIDHLHSTVGKKCYGYLRRYGNLKKTTVDQIRSIGLITANLERIADFAVNISRQTSHLSDPIFMERYDYHSFFKVIYEALDLVVDAVQDNEVSKAMQICEAELELDKLYRAKFSRILAEMTGGADPPNLVTSLFIFHYLERMGDCLLNIGEAVILSRMGEKLKIRQFQALREATANIRRTEGLPEEVIFEGITGTHSGCQIGKVTGTKKQAPEPEEVIYKEGELEKIQREKEQIERWNELVPGLPPKIVDYREDGNSAALLIEFLEGSNLQELLINPRTARTDQVLKVLQNTVMEIWTRTRQDGNAKSGLMKDLLKRIDDVFKVHPHFRGERKQIGGIEIPDFTELLKRNRDLDDSLSAPFTVFAHGDFNLDNIIYNSSRRRIHFVDLHRSGQMDYVRDVSVFIVSNFRLPVFDTKVRDRLNTNIASFYHLAKSFATDSGDETFEARLSLGLVRSFATSTRFELNRAFAEEMLSRSAYLLGLLDKHKSTDWKEFKVPDEVLFY